MTQVPPATEERKPRVAVGSQIRRWRTARGRTLAQVAAASGVNVGYLSQIENDKASPSLAVLGLVAEPGGRVGMHAHPGDEHHLVLRGRFRMSQGEHTVELGPGDYLRWDGSVPHDAEVVGDEEAAILIVR